MTEYPNDSFFIKPSAKSISDFQAIIDAPYDVNITRWILQGWEMFKKNAGISIAFAVLSVIAYALVSKIIPFGGILIQYPLLAGFIVASLMAFRNQNPEFKNYFWGFRHFLPLLLFAIVSTALIIIGIMLFVVPGIYLTVAYLFSPYLIVEKNIDFWAAMEVSRKKVNKNLFGMLSFAAILLLINLAGCIPLFFGLFITIPLTMSILTASYKEIFNAGEAAEAGKVSL